MKLKASMIVLMIFSTSACTTLEIVHAPVGCLGQPNINVKFTHEEADSMLDSTADKIVLIREIYRARIDAQCSINKKHDELHGMNK